MRGLAKPSLLIIDEMGYFNLSDNGGHYIFQVIRQRYENSSINFTSNKTFSEWGELLGDGVIATAIIRSITPPCKGVFHRWSKLQNER